MEIKISVIVPAYNLESYIERCINSICVQTCRDLEILAVDDGSIDQTGAVLEKMARKDHRICVLHQAHAGVSAARNAGMEKAQGGYIGFVDGDDVVERDMYRRLLENAGLYDADISHCGYCRVFPDHVEKGSDTGVKILQNTEQGVYDLLKGKWMEPGMWNKLYKREVIVDKRLDESIAFQEDLLFNYQAFQSSHRAVFEDRPLYHYVVRGHSATASKVTLQMLRDPFTVLQKIMAQEQGEHLAILRRRYLYLLEKVSTMENGQEDLQIASFQREKREELKELVKQEEWKRACCGKDRLQVRLAADCPPVYRKVNRIYTAWKGSRKYESIDFCDRTCVWNKSLSGTLYPKHCGTDLPESGGSSGG